MRGRDEWLVKQPLGHPSVVQWARSTGDDPRDGPIQLTFEGFGEYGEQRDSCGLFADWDRSTEPPKNLAGSAV
jgi:hypothetical protein